MVNGISKFIEYFSEYSGQYVFIGGTACDIILGKENIQFRATKDLDIVLIIEALNEEFINRFIDFIKEGEYQHIRKGSNENQFYRFESPHNSLFPVMIELFSRKPDYLKKLDQRLAPIHVSDSVTSLSAILLDENYYELLKEGKVNIDGVSVLNIEYLILFKIKAWLDLTSRKNNGENIDNKNIKKHKNDVIRLSAYLDPKIELLVSESIQKDINEFIDQTKSETVNMKNLGFKGIDYSMILERLKRCYRL